MSSSISKLGRCDATSPSFYGPSCKDYLWWQSVNKGYLWHKKLKNCIQLLLTSCHDGRLNHGRRPFRVKRLDIRSHPCNVRTSHWSSRENRVLHTSDVIFGRFTTRWKCSKDLHSWCCYIRLQFIHHCLSDRSNKQNREHKYFVYFYLENINSDGVWTTRREGSYNRRCPIEDCFRF